MSKGHVLAVYGHPDDEGQATGSLAWFLEHGYSVTLVCATRGEVGEISDAALSTPDTLWYTRELELRASMAQIGLRDVRFLPFRDSGMAGTPENEDPRSLHQAAADDVAGSIVAIIRELRPAVVITWDPNGGYGHPDHIAVHRHTLAAFDAAGDPDAFPGTGEPWAPGRLFWGAFTMKRFASVFLEMERRGALPEPLEPARKERFEAAMREPDGEVHVAVDVRPYHEAKRAASSMHRSQFGENSLFARIPADLAGHFFGEERFYQARPAWPEGTPPAQGWDALLG